jgi:hypothetical protein
LGRSRGAGLRAAVCADALMPSEGAGGRGRRREEGRWCELDGGKERRVDARMREFVGKEALKEMEGCMPLGGGSDCDVLLVRVMLSSERDGGRICISGTLVFTPWFTAAGPQVTRAVKTRSAGLFQRPRGPSGQKGSLHVHTRVFGPGPCKPSCDGDRRSYQRHRAAQTTEHPAPTADNTIAGG